MRWTNEDKDHAIEIITDIKDRIKTDKSLYEFFDDSHARKLRRFLLHIDQAGIYAIPQRYTDFLSCVIDNYVNNRESAFFYNFMDDVDNIREIIDICDMWVRHNECYLYEPKS